MVDLFDSYPALREMQEVPLFADLGFEFTGAGDGWSEVTLNVSPRTHNLYGIVHGGVWLIIADSAMGGALATLVGQETKVITGQSDFRWIRPLRGDTLRARGSVLHRGRTLNHCLVDLYDQAGTVVGRGTGTYVLLDPE